MLGDNAIKLFKDRHIAVVVYRNIHRNSDGNQVYYDTVIWRVVKGVWRKDAYYRPDDLPKVVLLLNDAANAILEMQQLDEVEGIDRDIGFISRTGCTIINHGGVNERPDVSGEIQDGDEPVRLADPVGDAGKGTRW